MKKTTRLLIVLALGTLPPSLFPLPRLSAQKRAITIDDYLALKAVGDPQLSPDGRWVVYTVTEYSLKDNRGTTRIWLADVATGQVREVTAGPGSDRQPRWAPDGKALAVALHGDSSVADNTNVDVYLLGPDGSGMRALTTTCGADNTPRYSPDGRWLAYLSMERAGFEADRERLMVMRRKDGRTEGGSPTEITAGWSLSVGSYTWCPDSKCIYAVVEERGRENIYRIDFPSFRRSVAVSSGVNTGVNVAPDGKTLVYVHQSNTQPAEVWVGGGPLTHHNDGAVAQLDLPPLESFGFVGALGDSVYGWILKPPGFDPAKRYPLVYLLHGGPQTAWLDLWHARWNYQMFAARGYVVAAVNRHGSTGYGQKFTDAVSQHWGDYPYEDLMKGLDVVARLPYVDSTRMGAAGASYGGYMVYWIAGHTNRFKALVAHDGVFNPVSMAGSTEELWFVDWEFGGTPYANRALYEKWSPLNFVQNWKTPLLIALPDIHSGAGPLVRLAGWFAGGLWCYVVARWLWIRFGRDLNELPGLLWGGVFLVVLELVMNIVARRHDATAPRE